MESWSKSKEIAQLCSEIASWVISQGPIPIVIGGDFNLCDQLPAFDNFTSAGILTDIHALMGTFPREATSRQAKKAIDYMFANTAAHPMIAKAWMEVGLQIPSTSCLGMPDADGPRVTASTSCTPTTTATNTTLSRATRQ